MPSWKVVQWKRPGRSSRMRGAYHGARVQQALGVERVLDRAHGGDLAGAPPALQPARLGDAHAVLGADRPAAVEREREDGVVGAVVRSEEIDVHVAVAQVA